MGNNAAVQAVGVGEVPMTTVVNGMEHHEHIANVLYVPDLAANLLSVNQLTAKGLNVTFAKGNCNIISPNGEVLGKAYLDGKLYKLQAKQRTGNTAAAAITSSPARDAQLWHERFGHLGIQNLQRLACKGMVKGLPKAFPTLERVCTGCMMGKQNRESFPKSSHRAKEPLELVHSDLCGPRMVPSVGKAKYFLTFIDDASRFTHVYFLQGSGHLQVQALQGAGGKPHRKKNKDLQDRPRWGVHGGGVQ